MCDPGNRYAYTMYIHSDLTYFEWGLQIFSLNMGYLPKIIQKHCNIPAEQPKIFKIANSELCDKIIKIDKQARFEVLHTWF